MVAAAAISGIMLLASCSIRVKGAKHGITNVMETYLVANNTIQCFVKPLYFRSGRSVLATDFTFRGKTDSAFSAKVNITAKEKMDSCHLVSDNNVISLLPGLTPPVRINNDGYRYFFTASNNTIFDQLNSGKSLKIITFRNGLQQEYTPSGKSAKKLNKLPKLILSEL
jgi:hypothetical protein